MRIISKTLLITAGFLLMCAVLSAQSIVTRIEYFIDSEPGFGNGISIPFSASENVNINTTLDLSALPNGVHWLYLRGKDSNGKWSPPQGRPFFKSAASPAILNITEAEYFFDADPGFGKGSSLPLTQGANVSINQIVDASSLPEGVHWLYLRAKDSDGKWSPSQGRPFFKSRVSPAVLNISKAEYFFDTDPGLGKGFSIPLTPGANVNISQIIDAGSLSEGVHWVYIRAKDSEGKWSQLQGRPFYKSNISQVLGNIIRVEYFFDIDPGFGHGNTIEITKGTDVAISKFFDISGIPEGSHKFYVRALDASGKWSFLFSKSFVADITPPAAPANLQAFSGSGNTTLKWRKNTETDFLKYRIYSGTTPGGEILTDSVTTGISDTTKIISGLSNGQNYYFYVTAVDSALLESPHSNEITIAAGSAPGAPVATEPGDISQTSFTMHWDSSAGATGYRVDVATDAAFTTIIGTFADMDIGTATSYVVSGLSAATTYYYRVRAYNTSGTGLNSNTVTVTTLAIVLAAPVANSPTQLTQTGFTANWTGSAGATGYKVDLSTDSNFGSFIPGYDKKDAGNVSTLNLTGLKQATDYYYRVFAYNGAGMSSSSNTASARTLAISLNIPNPPELKAGSDIGKTSFIASWNPSAGATGYRLDVSTGSGFISFIPGFNNLDVSGTSKTVTGLTPYTKYYYRVRAYNNDGTSLNSGTIEVTTIMNIPAKPIGITASSCNDLVTLSWRKNPESDILRYRIYRGSADNPTEKVDSTLSGITDTTKIFTGLVRGMTYYFRITAFNTEGHVSDYSSSVSVKVKNGVMPRIALKWTAVLVCYDLGDSIATYQWKKNSANIPGAMGQYYETNKQPGIYNVVIKDKSGCENISADFLMGGPSSVLVYPNPAKTSFSIRLSDDTSGDCKISIYNSLGYKLREYRINDMPNGSLDNISVSDLNNGVYYLEMIRDNERISYSRIVVIK